MTGSRARVNHDSYSDAYIGDILASSRTFAFVGASTNESRGYDARISPQTRSAAPRP